jgi:hypothetical protein
MKVVCQYHHVDVVNAFPGFKLPEGPDDALNMMSWSIDVGGNDCDGIIALRMGPEDALTLTLTMGSDEARRLAAMLVERADVEDAKLDDEDDEDDED